MTNSTTAEAVSGGMTRAVVAEFHEDSGGRRVLFSLTVIRPKPKHGGGTYLSRDTYDVDLSRTYGYLFDKSGSGGEDIVPVSGIYFISGDVAVKESPTTLVDGRDKPPWRSKRTHAIRERNRTRRLRRLPKSFELRSGEDLLEWLHRNAIEGGSVWCSKCRDHLPSEYPCEHVWWCHVACWWSTPTERCGCENREACDA